MALQMDVVTPIATITDAYIKVGKVVGTKDAVSAYVSAYTDSSCENKICDLKNEFCEGVNLFGFEPKLTDNWVKQAYVYLKTLDQFSTAIDC